MPKQSNSHFSHYLRYTVPYFYRTEYKGPKDSLTLMGQPNITGTSTTQAVIRKNPPMPGDGGYASYTWEIFGWHAGYEDCMGGVLLTIATSKKSFASQYHAAMDADQYIGRHHHTSVITGDPKTTAETWIQKAHRLWQEWEATIVATPMSQLP